MNKDNTSGEAFCIVKQLEETLQQNRKRKKELDAQLVQHKKDHGGMNAALSCAEEALVAENSS